MALAIWSSTFSGGEGAGGTSTATTSGSNGTAIVSYSAATTSRTILALCMPASWAVKSVVARNSLCAFRKCVLNVAPVLSTTGFRFHSMIGCENFPVLWRMIYPIFTCCEVESGVAANADSSTRSSTTEKTLAMGSRGL